MSEAKLNVGDLVVFSYSEGEYPGALRIVLISDEPTKATIRGYDFTRNSWRSFTKYNISNVKAMPLPCQKVNLDDVPFTLEEISDTFARKGMRPILLGDIVYAV